MIEQSYDQLDPLSREFLLEQGSCCGSKCQNCPYEPRHRHGATKRRKGRKEKN